MGVRRYVHWVILLTFLVATASLAKETTEETRPLLSRCYRALYRAAMIKIPRRVVLATIAIPVLGAPAWTTSYLSYHHDVIAAVTGHEHIGFGIYLDIDEVLKSFSKEEQALFRDPQANDHTIVELLYKRLQGDEDLSLLRPGEEGEDGGTGENLHWYSHDYFRGVRASMFFRPNGQPRGICRHKAKILAAVLNKLGIEARYEEVMLPDNGGPHVFVYLPKWDEVADPMKAVLRKRDIYEQLILKPAGEPLFPEKTEPAKGSQPE